MKKEIDARKELCPKPVIMTKKSLDDVEVNKLNVIVDNEVAKDNVSKLIKSYGYSFTVNQSEEEDYYINITKGEKSEEDEKTCPPNLFKDLTIAISSREMGSGEKELGDILMRSYIYTVKEITPLPRSIVFFNAGVYLACEESQILDDLKEIKDMGVEILVCGTCLDYYKLNDKIKVGEIANMYSIYEAMRKNNTINI